MRAPANLRGRALPVERITRAVTRLHDPVAVLLADAGSGKSAVVRWWAALALASIDPSATDVAVLTEALRDGRYDTRRRVAAVLGELGSAARAALPVLKTALHDEDVEVRQRAAAALKRLRKSTPSRR